jgi:hypothetical protein
MPNRPGLLQLKGDLSGEEASRRRACERKPIHTHYCGGGYGVFAQPLFEWSAFSFCVVLLIVLLPFS